MRVIEPGHIYALANVDGSDEQMIRFVRRRDELGEKLDGSRRTPGVLTQELLRVAIDRTLYLYAEAPCDEDTTILEHLRAALTLYESRAARRTIEQLAKPESAHTCGICGHILCGHVRGARA
jgi:hypothetical protein